VPTDTTPAEVGIVAGSQLKDQRVPFPDPARPEPKLADLFVFVFGSRASRAQAAGLPFDAALLALRNVIDQP